MTIRILTDSTAIFSSSTFTGYGLVRVAPYEVKLSPFPQASSYVTSEFAHELAGLDRVSDHILVVVSSAGLAPVAEAAEQAARQHGGHAKVAVIDTQNTGAGLGILVEIAAQAAQAGASAIEIDRVVRNTIPRVFSLFCVPDLNQLATTGHLSGSQAGAARILGIMPIFLLEDGVLSPMAKVRTPRHMFEAFQEFLEEFSNPSHVVLVKGQNSRLRTRPLRQYVLENFPEALYNESLQSPSLSAFLGPQTLGLTVLDAG